MMHRYILVTLILSLTILQGCTTRFVSKVEATVDVYRPNNPDDLISLKKEPNISSWAVAIIRAERASFEAKDAGLNLIETTKNLNQSYQRLVDSYARFFNRLSTCCNYVDKGKQYPDVWKTILENLQESLKDTPEENRFTALCKNLENMTNPFFEDNNSPKEAVIVQGINSYELFNVTLKDQISDEDQKKILGYIATYFKTKNSNIFYEIEKFVSKDPEVIRKLIGTLSSMRLSVSDLEIEDRLFDPWRKNGRMFLDEPADDLAEALEDGDLHQALEKIVSRRNDFVTNVVETDEEDTNILRQRAILAMLSMNQDVDQFLAKLENESRPLRINIRDFREVITTLTSDQGSIYSRAYGSLSDSQKTQIAEELAVPLPDLETPFAKLEEATWALADLNLESRFAERSANMSVETIKNQPFLEGDPNLGTILDSKKGSWHDLDLDLDHLSASAEGDAQYIIVMDNPTTFRLKRMTADPKQVVGLRLDLASAAFKTISSLALRQAGLGGFESSTTSAPPTSNEAIDAQVDMLRKEYQDVIIALRGRLDLMIDTVGDDDTEVPDAVKTRITDLLTAAELQLKSLKTLAEKINNQPGTAGTNDPETEPAVPET